MIVSQIVVVNSNLLLPIESTHPLPRPVDEITLRFGNALIKHGVIVANHLVTELNLTLSRDDFGE